MPSRKRSFLLQLLDSDGLYSRKRFESLRDDAYTILSRFPRFDPFVTEHGPAHASRVIVNLELLLRPRADQVDLGPREAFCLLSSAVLHDLGYAIDRSAAHDGEDEHHKLSADFVAEYHQELGLRNEALSGVLAGLCLGHRRRVSISEAFPTAEVTLGTETVRVRLLAALLSLADALDCTSERAPEFESSYVLKLPAEARKHWRAAQLVRGVKLDHKSAKIILDAQLRSPEDRDILEYKLRHLQEELDRALPYLLPHIVFVWVEARYNSSVLSARTLAAPSAKSVQAKVETFLDLETRYHLRVTGHSDCRMTRTTTFINAGPDPVSYRSHYFLTDSSVLDLQRHNIKAKADGAPLKISITSTRRNLVEFDIVFLQPVKPRETSTYSYAVTAPDSLPDDTEFFTGNDYGHRVHFELVVPSAFALKRLWCEEILPDGQHTEIVDVETPEPSRVTKTTKKFALDIDKTIRGSNCRFYWTWERPAQAKADV